MSRDTPEPGSTPDNAATPAETAADTPDDTGVSDAARAGRQAARYRARLRDTEAERDSLRVRVAALQRAEVERIAATANVKPEAVWATTELADLLTEHGDLNPETVTEAVTKTRSMFEPRTVRVPTPPGKAIGDQPDSGFTEAFRPASKRAAGRF